MGGFLPNYSQRDPQDLLAAFKQNMTRLTQGQWTDFTQNDVGYALMAAFVELGDMDAFFNDANLVEMFLSVAQLRESVVRIAKMLNYPITRATSATVQVQLTFPQFNSQVVLPEGTLWSINGTTFTITDPVIIQAGQTSVNVGMTQGTPYTGAFTAPGTNWWRFSIPNNSSVLSVNVNGEQWTEVDTFIGVESPQVYKVYEESNGTLTVLFGANINSYAPLAGATITVSSILTNGAGSNNGNFPLTVRPISVIRLPSGADVTNNFTGTTTSIISGGLDRESTDSIRANAPGIYQMQGRLVTKLDYESFINAMPEVQDCQVVGGQDLNDYGTVHIMIYGDSPYYVNPGLIDLIYQRLSALNILTVIPKVYACAVTEIDLTVSAVLQDTVNDVSVFENNLRTAISNQITGLRIGNSLYGSVLDAAMQGVAGGQYFDWTAVVRSFTQSTAGLIKIQTIKNPIMTSVTLTDSVPTTLFSGNASSAFNAATGIFTNSQAQSYTDQLITLQYTNAGDNVLSYPGQKIVLKTLTINSSFAS